MGVDYTVRCFYGIILDYKELAFKLKHNRDFKNTAQSIGCEFPGELINIWEEMGNDYHCVFPYFDPPSDDAIYVYGEEFIDHERSWGKTDGVITDFKDLQEWYTSIHEETEKKVSAFCKQYSVNHTNPQILMLLSVW